MRKGYAKQDGAPRDVDRTLFTILDEKASLHLGINLWVCSGSCSLEDEDFQESNLMHVSMVCYDHPSSANF